MRVIWNQRTRNRALGLLALGLTAFAPAARAQTMTATERQQLVEKLDASQNKFFAALQGVSEAQWHWKPAPDKWSIAEVADHLDLAEIKTPQLVHDLATNAPATPEKKGEVSGKDRRVVSEIPDRTQHRMMRPDFLAPTDRWPSPAGLETRRATRSRF